MRKSRAVINYKPTPEVSSDVVIDCADYLAQPLTPAPGKERYCNDTRVEESTCRTKFRMFPWTVRAIVSGMLLLALAGPVSAADLDWWGRTKVTIGGWYAQAKSKVPFVFTPQTAIIGDNQIVLSWDAPDTGNPLGYKIYVGLTSGVYDAPIDVGNVLTYTATGLVNGTPYWFVATAYDNTNESGYSNEVTGLP